MRTRFAVVAALMLVAAVAAACGSSDDKGTSKADFVKQANAICAKGNKEIETGAKKLFTDRKRPSNAKVAKFVKDTALPSTRKQVDAVKKLDPPKGDESKVKAITDAAEAATAKVEANPVLAVNAGAKDPFAKSNKLARDYGLKVCGST